MQQHCSSFGALMLLSLSVQCDDLSIPVSLGDGTVQTLTVSARANGGTAADSFCADFDISFHDCATIKRAVLA